MKRLVDNILSDWKNSFRRKPLIVRGARQVGKTFTITNFGKTNFKTLVVIDFERDPGFKNIFENDLQPARIIDELELATSKKITTRETLIFFDEIQECPRALVSLRYFYEEMPGLHVIAAGSLLEFAMGEISFPVGRIQFTEIFPLNFLEFQMALGNERAIAYLSGIPKELPDASHQFLLKQVKDYFFVGGMPEAVKTFAETKSINRAIEVQGEICNSLKQDFAKYNPQVDKQCLAGVLTSLAANVGKQTKYVSLSNDFSNPTIKKAYNTLVQAKLVNTINSVNPQGFPLQIMTSKVFKTCMLDIGIMNFLCGIYKTDEYFKNDLLSIYRGAMAEQFAAQEIAMNQNNELFYWSRQAKSSSAEIDYVMAVNDRIIPVEVKSAKAGSLRSMHQFLKEFPECRGGYVFSANKYAELPEQKLTFIPLYFAYSASKNMNANK
ncbi:MAG: AAA family ATPase [Ignavibacteriae bacterium]|nr:AAA family ATPase [Ignavibacteriota bacterium]